MMSGKRSWVFAGLAVVLMQGWSGLHAATSASAVREGGKTDAQEKRVYRVLQNAIMCRKLGPMTELESYLKRTVNYAMDGKPVELPKAVSVFGLSVRKVALFQDDELGTSFTAHFPGTTPEKVAKAARARKNDQGDYYRQTKVGSINVGMASGEVTLICTPMTDS